MSALPRTAPEDPLVAFLAIAEALEASAQACHGVGDACAASARAMRAFASGAVVPDGTKPAEKELTIAAVAALLGISTWQVRHAIRTGRLRAAHYGASKLFRIRESDVEAFRNRSLIR